MPSLRESLRRLVTSSSIVTSRSATKEKSEERLSLPADEQVPIGLRTPHPFSSSPSCSPRKAEKGEQGSGGIDSEKGLSPIFPFSPVDLIGEREGEKKIADLSGPPSRRGGSEGSNTPSLNFSRASSSPEHESQDASTSNHSLVTSRPEQVVTTPPSSSSSSSGALQALTKEQLANALTSTPVGTALGVVIREARARGLRITSKQVWQSRAPDKSLALVQSWVAAADVLRTYEPEIYASFVSALASGRELPVLPSSARLVKVPRRERGARRVHRLLEALIAAPAALAELDDLDALTNIQARAKATAVAADQRLDTLTSPSPTRSDPT